MADTSDTVETRETSGSVTAVTSEEQTGDGLVSDDQGAPGEDGQTDESGTDSSGGNESAEASDASAAEESGQASLSASQNGSDGVYIVEEGDTLAIISRKMYGDVDHVDAICRMNGIADGNLIYVGQKLLLP